MRAGCMYPLAMKYWSMAKGKLVGRGSAPMTHGWPPAPPPPPTLPALPPVVTALPPPPPEPPVPTVLVVLAAEPPLPVVALVVAPVVDALAPGTAVPLAEPLSKQPNVVRATATASDTNQNLSHVRNMNAFLLGAG